MSVNILSNVELVNRENDNCSLIDYNRLKLSKGTFNAVKGFSMKHQQEEKVVNNSYDVVNPVSVATLDEPAKGLRVSPDLVSTSQTPGYQSKPENIHKEVDDRVKITGSHKDLNGKMEYFSKNSNEINVGNIYAQNSAAPAVNNAFAASKEKPLQEATKDIKPVETVKLGNNINDNNLIKFKADAEEVKVETPAKEEPKDVFSVLKKVEESSPVQPAVSSINKLSEVENLKKLRDELEAEKRRKVQLEAEKTAKAEQLSKTQQEAEMYMKKLLSELKNDNASTEKSIQDINQEQEEVESFVGEYKSQEPSRTR